MEIIASLRFLSIVKDCYLLLDTNVLIDTLNHPTRFGELFNEIRKNNVTLVTIDPVILEFLKGTPTPEKHQERNAITKNIIKTTLPISQETFFNCQKLLLEYKEEGKAVSITDLLLGATIIEYKNIFLMTKNTTDFPTNIFKMETFINLIHRKSIQSYGVYSYPNT